MNWIIRITAFFLTLLTIIFSIQVLEGEQKEYPLDAQATYDIKVMARISEKEDILQGLHNLAQDHHVTLIRPMFNSADKVQDLAWFGSALPNNPSVDTENRTIYWVDNQKPGTILPVAYLGDTPINGTYYSLQKTQLTSAQPLKPGHKKTV